MRMEIPWLNAQKAMRSVKIASTLTAKKILRMISLPLIRIKLL